jgi:hypothetical protein
MGLLKITGHAFFEVARLANVEQGTVGRVHPVHTGEMGQ